MDIATIFGVLGLITNSTWPLLKTRTYLLLGQVLGSSLMCVHFLLLGANTAAALLVVAGIQAALAIPLEKNPKFKQVYLASLVFTPIVCWVTWHGYPSIFSSLAIGLFCYANLHVNVKHLRLYFIGCILLWACHNILVVSYPALAANIIALSTSIYALYRDFMPNKSSKKDALTRASS